MAVIDSLIVKNGSEFLPIDSYENQMIDEIVVEGNTYHFAKQRDIEGETEVVTDHSVKEPIISLAIEGNSEQYQGLAKPIKEIDLSKFTYSGEALDNGITYVLASDSPVKLPINVECKIILTKTGNDTLPSGFAIVAGYSREDLIIGSSVTHMFYQPPEAEGAFFDYNISAPFYIGVGNIDTGIPSGDQFTYETYLKNNFKLEIQPVADVQVPSPYFPQPIHNANDNGMSLELSGENLFNAQGGRSKTVGSFVYANNSIYRGSIGDGGYMYLIYANVYKAGTYTISAKGEFNNVNNIGLLTTVNIPDSTYNSYYGAYRTNLVSSSVTERSVTFTATQDFQIGFAFGGTTGGSGKIYDIMFSTTGGEYKPYTETTIAIPPSVTVNGETVSLSMSLYDKIIVDRLNSKVEYVKGSYELVFDETRANSSNLYFSPQNNVNFFSYRVANSNFLKNNVGLCSHFRKGVWNPLTSNNTFAIIGASSYANISFRLTPTTTLVEFRQLLIDKANEGNPVKVIAQRVTPLEYDITNTDLGQELLALATHKGTNTFTISSEIPVSKTALSYWRQIIPNE